MPRSPLRAVLAACALACLPGPGLAGAPVLPGEARRLQLLETSARDFEVAISAHRRGDLEASIHAYGLALEKDPDFVEALVGLARALADQELLDEADRWLDRALALRPDYYAIYKVRGLVALRRGRAALAVDALVRARELRPEDAEVLTNLGVAFLELGRLADAADVLTRSVRLAPASAGAALNLALAHDRGADPGRAAYHYRRFLELAAPGDPLRAQVQSRLEELAGPGAPAVSAKPPAGSASPPPRPNPNTEESSHARED